MLRVFILALATVIAAPAFAQSTTALRATVVSVAADGASFTAQSRAGEPATVRLKPETRFIAVIPAALADVKAGAYVGVAAVPDGDSGLKALEVHIFPEAMRGAGEGFRPFDLAPKSSMTNGALSERVETVDGPKLTISYKGGSQIIRIDASTAIVAFAPGDKADLKPGAAVIARGVKAADGVIDAGAVLIGRNGLTPPM
jgi:hypothetical protein